MSINVFPAGFSITEYSKSRGGRIVDTLVVILLIILVLFTPLPFGSVGRFSILMIEIIAAVCLVLWLAKLFFLANPKELVNFQSYYREQKERYKRTPSLHRHVRLARLLHFFTFGRWPRKNPSFDIILEDLQPTPHKLPWYSFFGYPVRNTGLERIAIVFLLLIAVQMIPLPDGIAALLSPGGHALYRGASKASGFPLAFHPLSMNAFATLSKFLQYGAYFMIYLVAVNTLHTRPFYRAVIFALIGSALFQTIYGLYELFSGHQYIFWHKKRFFLNCATGTFINRNHYAAYLGLSLPMIMGKIGGRISQIKRTTGKIMIRILRTVETSGSIITFQLFLIGLIFVGIAFSLSLTGLLAIVLSLTVFVVLYARIRKNRAVNLIVLFALLAIVAAWFGSSTFRTRIQGIPEEAFSERSRFMVWKDTLRIFLHFPATGTGAGTFPDIFPVYRKFGSTTAYSEAHNEFVQMLSENGIVMLFLFALMFLTFFSRLRKILKGPISRCLFLQTGAFSAVIMLGFHNLIDFSLEMPAIFVTGVILTALFFGTYRDEKESWT